MTRSARCTKRASRSSFDIHKSYVARSARGSPTRSPRFAPRWRCMASTGSRARYAARRSNASSTRITRRTTAPRARPRGACSPIDHCRDCSRMTGRKPSKSSRSGESRRRRPTPVPGRGLGINLDRPSRRCVCARNMRKRLAGFLLAAALAGCGPKHASFVKVDNVALGRVVVYRNGVAFYERRAIVEGGTLTVSVPRDRVDDFLKSLTVVDAKTGDPLPVSIPRDQAQDGNYLVMKLQLPNKDKVADVVLTYVTESPSWKPSYRVVVGGKGKVMLEGWAIVDNTSG